jgi:hypothetical protein
MSPKRKIVANSRKLDGIYCFKATNDQYHGKISAELSNLRTLREIENFDTIFGENKYNLEDPSCATLSENTVKAASNHLFRRRCLKTFKVIKSVFFMLTLIFFALFEQKYGNKNLSLCSIYASVFITLVFEGYIESFLFLRYRKAKKISSYVSFVKWAYLLGILCFILTISLLPVTGKFVSAVHICIIGLFSVASSCIAISYLIMGWIIYNDAFIYVQEMAGKSCCCRTRCYMFVSLFMFLVSSIGFIILADLKIYDNLITSLDLIIPWSTVFLVLIILQSIILTYYSFIKADITLCDCYDICNRTFVNGRTLFIGWDRCLYFVLELLAALKLDGFLFKETDWLFILIPAYLAFMTRIFIDICYDNDIHEIFP